MKVIFTILIIGIIISVIINHIDYNAAILYHPAYNNMQNIEDKIANDAVKEYEIAARQDDKMQMYSQAGMCCAAFLQAQDEPNYRKWKAIEDNLGAQIGIPKQYR